MFLRTKIRVFIQNTKLFRCYLTKILLSHYYRELTPPSVFCRLFETFGKPP